MTYEEYLKKREKVLIYDPFTEKKLPPLSRENYELWMKPVSQWYTRADAIVEKIKLLKLAKELGGKATEVILQNL